MNAMKQAKKAKKKVKAGKKQEQKNVRGWRENRGGKVVQIVDRDEALEGYLAAQEREAALLYWECQGSIK